ncbi:MAG: serine/threonine-protein phosphatase [Lachnospiraceae bacterium]|nr:serine/threonine-protein phosphatase [Lachnospiraceae bacterium]
MWFRSRSSKDTSRVIYSAYTDAGSRPGTNQDSIYAFNRSDFAVFCVADGMGGHVGGEVASSQIVRSIERWSTSLPTPYQAGAVNLFDGFESIVDEANSIIYNQYNQGSICGSTLSAVIIYKGKYCAVSAGDSRVYRADGAGMIQITRDDVWQGFGNTDEYDANKGKLLKAVGVSENLICNRISGSIKRNDLFFICSDGIYKTLGDEYLNLLPQVTRKADSASDLDIIMNSVRTKVAELGAPDNNSGILIRCM